MAVTTLGSVVIALGVPTRDNLLGQTSVASAVKNQFTDNDFITQTDNIYAGSEVLWLDYIDETGSNPHIYVPTDRVPNTPGPDDVAGSIAATGTFTLRDDWNSANGVPQGMRFLLMNIRGKGIPFDYRLMAARYAIESMADEGIVTEVILGPGVSQTSHFTIPAGLLDTVFDVRIVNLAGASTQFDVPIRPSAWQLTPGRGVHVTARQVQSTAARVVVRGRVWPTWSDNLNTVIPISRDTVLRGALEWLTLYPRGAKDAAAHQALFQERLHNQAEYWFPNEERLY